MHVACLWANFTGQNLVVLSCNFLLTCHVRSKPVGLGLGKLCCSLVLCELVVLLYSVSQLGTLNAEITVAASPLPHPPPTPPVKVQKY